MSSPGKIKKLKAILGANYEIIAALGLEMDSPPTRLGITAQRGTLIIRCGWQRKRTTKPAIVRLIRIKQGWQSASLVLVSTNRLIRQRLAGGCCWLPLRLRLGKPLWLTPAPLITNGWWPFIRLFCAQKVGHPVATSQLLGLLAVEFTTPMATKLDEIAAGRQNGRDYWKAF